jgi:hypothetical protein
MMTRNNEGCINVGPTLQPRTSRRRRLWLCLGLALAVVTTATVPARANGEFGLYIVAKFPTLEITERRTSTFGSIFRFLPAGDFKLEELQLVTTGNFVFLGGDRVRITKFVIPVAPESDIAPIYAGNAENGDGTIRAIVVGTMTLPGLGPTRITIASDTVQVKILPLFPATTTTTTTTTTSTTAATTSTTTASVRTTTPAPPTVTAAPISTVIVVPPAPPVIAGGNRPPVAQASQVIVASGASVDVPLDAADPDGNQLTYVVTRLPTSGRLTGQVPKLVYSPDPGFIGTDAMSFTASDGTASSASATVTITVTGSNAPPASTAAAPNAKKKATKKKATKKKLKTTAKRR